MQSGSTSTTAFPANGEAVVATTRSVPRLEWTDDSGPRSATVERRCVVGSAPHCDVIVADQTVSRVHAEIEPREEGIWIRDLNSRNGTFVEGVRVESACVLHGFSIGVGATTILVDYANAEHKQVESWPSERFGPLLGRSQVMRELFATLARLSPLESSIMITGETGTGKELVARAIHQASARSSGPFVVVDCATLSESLIEAELFGHTKGAFTGAHVNRAGAIESADGGTVFLDEIGELPLGMQPKLLRVLESSTVRRIGESKHRNVDVRFVTATHRDLLSMVNRGEFRKTCIFVWPFCPFAFRGFVSGWRTSISSWHISAKGRPTGSSPTYFGRWRPAPGVEMCASSATSPSVQGPSERPRRSCCRWILRPSANQSLRCCLDRPTPSADGRLASRIP